MAPRGNQCITSAHLRKHWQTRVKTWFNQPGRKLRRRENRLKKAKDVAPRPVSGLLRPIVRCPTNRYNSKLRLGRGFTLQELKEAGVERNFARSVGIAIDYRRTNQNMEALKLNAERLKEYRSKLVLFPKNGKFSKDGKKEQQVADIKTAVQLVGKILPVQHVDAKKKKVEIRKVTDAERKVEVYRLLRALRTERKFRGKRAKEVADDAAALK